MNGFVPINQLCTQARPKRVNPNISKRNFAAINISIADIKLEIIGLNCNDLETKCIAIHIDEQLTRKKYLSHVNSEINITISRAIFSINQIQHLLPYDSLRTLYCLQISLSDRMLGMGNANHSIINDLNTPENSNPYH